MKHEKGECQLRDVKVSWNHFFLCCFNGTRTRLSVVKQGFSRQKHPQTKGMKYIAGTSPVLLEQPLEAPAWRVDGLIEILPVSLSLCPSLTSSTPFFSLQSAPFLWHVTDLVHLQDNQRLIKKVEAAGRKKWRGCRGESQRGAWERDICWLTVWTEGKERLRGKHAAQQGH